VHAQVEHSRAQGLLGLTRKEPGQKSIGSTAGFPRTSFRDHSIRAEVARPFSATMERSREADDAFGQNVAVDANCSLRLGYADIQRDLVRASARCM